MRRSLYLALVLFVATAIASAWAPAVAQNSAPKILRINWGGFPETLDPQFSYHGQWGISGADFEGLTRFDEEQRVAPAAAESWEFSDDGLTLTFHLRDGLRFSDGSPITAEHFRFGAERMCDPRLDNHSVRYLFDIVGCEAMVTSLDSVATPDAGEAAYAAAKAEFGVSATDDRTLVVRLLRPAPYLPAVAGLWSFLPLKEEVIAAGGPEWWADPATRIGNGPFRAVVIDAEGEDSRIEFVRNEHYWGGKTKLDGITFLTAESEFDDALAAYQRGEVDVIWPYEDRLTEIEADPVLSKEMVLIPAPGLGVYYFNLAREPFQDPKVREAFSYAFDREGYCREINYDTCDPTYSWIPAGQPGAIETDAYAFDPAKARQALAESSYGGPENLPPIIWYRGESDTGMVLEAEWFAQQYRQVLGVDFQVEVVPDEQIDAFYDAVGEERPQLMEAAWFSDFPDPIEWMRPFWTCGADLLAADIGYCNPELDALIAQADAELDPGKRMALYEEAGRMLVADAPIIFAHTDVNLMLVKPYVVGYSRTTPNWQYPGWTDLLSVDIET